jgi:hypothetical protein
MRSSCGCLASSSTDMDTIWNAVFHLPSVFTLTAWRSKERKIEPRACYQACVGRGLPSRWRWRSGAVSSCVLGVALPPSGRRSSYGAPRPCAALRGGGCLSSQ